VISKPTIEKLGTIDCDMVGVTPIVLRDRLYRFEYVRGPDTCDTCAYA